jgi:adenylosuccinate synthase
MLDQAKPVIEILPGWQSDISSIREFDKLPKQAQDYVLYIEKMISVPVSCISIGPNREQMIKR